MLTWWYPLLKSTDPKTTSYGSNLFKLLLDSSKGVPMHFRLGFTLRRSVANLALVVPSVVLFYTKEALEKVLVG